MVSFSCEACGDVLTKKKLDPHTNRCRGATFTCIDCMVYFPGTTYRAHTSCMTEDQKYQGSLYKPKKQKSSHPEPQHQDVKETQTPKQTKRMSQQAYVEDITEEYEAYREYEINSDDDDSKSTADLPPEAPTPPPAVDTNVNVFDFLVNATPTTSTLALPAGPLELSEDTALVRYDQDANGYVDQSGYVVDDEDMIHYGTGPLPPTVRFQTPAPKGERRRTKEAERDTKKDKKRKRLHIDTNSPLATDNGPGDHVMTDAPLELHSGLTGGLDRLMRRPVFPPSPDYSGGDAGDHSPASPIKKSKHTKAAKPSRVETLGNNLKALVSGSKPTKVSKKRKHSSERKEKKRHHHRTDGEKAPKLIEYRPSTADGKEADGTMVVFKPRSELFLSMCNKGPESERGYSMNKALKRFHRERTSSGSGLGKTTEEKELWRSLRMRRNDRGEIVLFSI